MSREVLANLPRWQRKKALDNEIRRRKSGEWGIWETFYLPSGVPGGRGWNAEVRRVHKCKVFSVLDRPMADGTRHLAVSSLTGDRPSWWEMQRIKNEIAGDAATAIEVYPPQTEVVDGADMFHIWVIPGGLPFSLASKP